MGIFKFRQFSVRDDDATMKVGTDAVLLGAWADLSDAKSVLDVGTGSGVIALMVAQRTDPSVRIDAVELLPGDARQALENVDNSPWRGRISVLNSSIQEFTPGSLYDCILCNPPYFANSLLPPDPAKSKARHATTLTRDELLDASIRLLSPEGRLNIILPFRESEDFVLRALAKNIFLNRLTRFFTRPGRDQERALMTFGRRQARIREDSLVLYNTLDRWTDDYRNLTGDFYLER